MTRPLSVTGERHLGYRRAVGVAMAMCLTVVQVPAADRTLVLPRAPFANAEETQAFLAEFSAFQAHDAEAAKFCRRFVDPRLFDKLRKAWWSKFGAAVRLRDAEVERVRRHPVADAGERDGIDIRDVVEASRIMAESSDLLYHDLASGDPADLSAGCARRLAELVDDRELLRSLLPVTSPWLEARARAVR